MTILSEIKRMAKLAELTTVEHSGNTKVFDGTEPRDYHEGHAIAFLESRAETFSFLHGYSIARDRARLDRLDRASRRAARD